MNKYEGQLAKDIAVVVGACVVFAAIVTIGLLSVNANQTNGQRAVEEETGSKIVDIGVYLGCMNMKYGRTGFTFKTADGRKGHVCSGGMNGIKITYY